MDVQERIDQFINDGPPFAVVGSSRNRTKYGNKILRCFIQHAHRVYPIHPKEAEIEGLQCYPDLNSVPETIQSVSIITPPAVTESVVQDAIEMGVINLWMQPGAESKEAIHNAENAGINVIHSGPCLLVVMGYKE